MNSNERIKELRTALKLSQSAFGQRIGVSRDVINNYEQLRVNVPPPTERAICAEFGVNPKWLQTGKGEMLVKTANTFIDELAEKYNVDDFVKRALIAYMSLSDSEKTAVKRFIDKLTPPPEDEQEIYRAANSSDHHKDEITKLSKEQQERNAKATRMTTQNSDL
ncbi:MAG: helix-turn-helix transcriptional regulator [Oscillospiraceae bacterium]|nr:helix-turn-helix transcriptional regulator [Oscillospiraceae bacterium]